MPHLWQSQVSDVLHLLNAQSSCLHTLLCGATSGTPSSEVPVAVTTTVRLHMAAAVLHSVGTESLTVRRQ